MQSDPPQKQGFNTLINADRAFTNWHGFNDYTTKLGCLNEFLEKKDAGARKLRYKDELDSLARLKLSREHSEKEREREYFNRNRCDLETLKIQEATVTRQLQEFERKRQTNCLADAMLKSEAAKEENRMTNLKRAQELETNQKMIELDDYQRKIKKAQIAEEFKHSYAVDLEMKLAQKKREKEEDTKYMLSEQFLLQKQEEKNKEFLMKLKNGWKQNTEIVALYEKLYQDKEARKKAMEFQTVERPYLDKLRADLEKEEKELRIRETMKKEKNDFLLKQIEHNKMKKQLLNFEEAVLDNEKLQRDLEAKQTQDRAFKENYKKKLEENLRVLRQQIEENRKALILADNMNQAEADFNNSAPVKMDYVHPSDDLISGLPGIGISHDRRQQLDALDRNMAIAHDENLNFADSRKNDPHSHASMARLLHTIKNENLLNNEDVMSSGANRMGMLAETAQRIQEEKKYSAATLKENAGFRNEYDLIRFKNRNNKINIISNQLNPYC